MYADAGGFGIPMQVMFPTMQNQPWVFLRPCAGQQLGESSSGASALAGVWVAGKRWPSRRQ
jgi:hypothetical protein